MKIFPVFMSILPAVFRYSCYLFILCAAFSCGGCHSRKLPDVPQVSTSLPDTLPDTTEFHVDLLMVDSIHITFADDLRSDTFIHEKDWNTLAEHMISCNYDTFRNQNNAHISMVPPDYTVCITYKEMPADHKDWLLIWEEAGTTRFRNIWYHLPETSRTPIYNLLHRYKQ